MSPESRTCAVVVGQQRSGTTVFVWSLGTSPEIQSFGEVFHDAERDRDYNYFNFLQRFECDAEVKYLPDEQYRRTLFDEYMKRIYALADTQVPLLDVKYNSWHHLNTYWHNEEERPNLLGLMIERGYAILHLWRRNVFEQALSMRYAEQRNAYHVHIHDSASEPPHTTVRIDCGWMQAEMERSLRNTARFRRFLEGHDRAVEIQYEEMMDGEFISNTYGEAIANLLGVQAKPFGPAPLRKVTPPPREVIENAEELKSFFAGTKYEEYVITALER
ncbi:MAG: hypothetical protein H6838_07435 [Planctomycetes bacterium]|nr:hypothetical protein [Planctomycetota bacterium]